MKPSEFKISISVESYVEKTAESYRSCRSQILIGQTEDFNEDCVKISRTFREISHQRASQSSPARSGRFIVLNDSASPKKVIKLYLHFFRFFEMFRAV